jgi:long-chain acyl-CoA synthetase
MAAGPSPERQVSPAVRLAAVIGVPDSYHGEIVKACVVLREAASASPAELIAYCESQLAPFKVPRHMELRKDLPMSAVGKVLHRVLRDELVPAPGSR